MRYVAAILFIGFACFGFVTCGLKDSPSSAADTKERLADELDHIADDFEATNDPKRFILLLRNKANTLRQPPLHK